MIYRRFLQNSPYHDLVVYYTTIWSVFKATQVASPESLRGCCQLSSQLLRRSATTNDYLFGASICYVKDQNLNQIFRDVYIGELYHLWPAKIWMNCNISTSCVCPILNHHVTWDHVRSRWNSLRIIVQLIFMILYAAPHKLFQSRGRLQKFGLSHDSTWFRWNEIRMKAKR